MTLTDTFQSELLRDRCLVDGAWIEADDGARFDVNDPATGV